MKLSPPPPQILRIHIIFQQNRDSQVPVNGNVAHTSLVSPAALKATKNTLEPFLIFFPLRLSLWLRGSCSVVPNGAWSQYLQPSHPTNTGFAAVY